MKESGCEVYATCTRCHWMQKPLPLDPILKRFGPKFSLFDRRPRCRQEGCTGRVAFMYSPGGATPYRICSTETSVGAGWGRDGWFIHCTDQDLLGIIGHPWIDAGSKLWAVQARHELNARLAGRERQAAAQDGSRSSNRE